MQILIMENLEMNGWYGSWVLKIFAGLLLGTVIRALYRAGTSPLKNIPGPFLARFSRLWELGCAIRGNLHTKTIQLHEKHGMDLSSNLLASKKRILTQLSQDPLYDLDLINTTSTRLKR